MRSELLWLAPIILMQSFTSSSRADEASCCLDCTRFHEDRAPNPDGGRIKLIVETDGEAKVEHRALDDAVGMWKQTCRDQMPELSNEGNIAYRVRFHEGPNDLDGCGVGCACTISNTRARDDGKRYLTSAITHLFQTHPDGRGDCSSHRAQTIAHEIGHVLGHRHPENPYSTDCHGNIMSFRAPRQVRLQDCRALETAWRSSPPDSTQEVDNATSFGFSTWRSAH